MILVCCQIQKCFLISYIKNNSLLKVGFTFQRKNRKYKVLNIDVPLKNKKPIFSYITKYNTKKTTD